MKKLKLIGASIIGNTLEWYEFSLYVHFTPLFAVLFFPVQFGTHALTLTLLIFGLGFLARMTGGLFFGYIGDRFGRRRALLSTILLIAAPTALLAVLPTYAAVGMLAPFLLLAIRLLQSVPAGGEFPGVMCYLTEMAGPSSRGFMGSFAFLGSQLGSVLSTTEFLLCKSFISQENMLSWGWRLSFAFGALLGLTGFFLRKRLHETLAFQAAEPSKKPILETVKHHKKALVQGALLSILPLSGWYLVFVFTPLYFSQVLNMSFFSVLLLNIAMLMLSNLLLPFLGHLADRFGPRKLFIWSAWGTLLLAFPFYGFASGQSFILIFSFEALLIACLSVHFALLPSLLSALFPTSVRYTCVGISYNISNALLGGVTPVLAFSLVQHTELLWAPALFLVVSSLISLGVTHWKTKGYF